MQLLSMLLVELTRLSRHKVMGRLNRLMSSICFKFAIVSFKDRVGFTWESSTAVTYDTVSPLVEPWFVA